VKNLDLLIPNQDKSGDTWLWATVTQVSPLRVRLDGDEVELPITPENLSPDPELGERVWVQLSGHRVIVHGGSKGIPRAPEPSLHDNPGFDIEYQNSNSPAGWTTFWSSNTTWSLDTTDYIQGTKSVKAVYPVDANTRLHSNTVFGVSPSAVVTFTIWAKASVPGELDVALMSQIDGNPDFFNGRTDLVQQYRTFNVGTEWQKFTTTWSVPAGHTVARFTMFMQSDDQGRTFWLDGSSSEMVLAPAAPMPEHSHPTPVLNIAQRTYNNNIGAGGSWANGSYITTGLWEPGPTWPSNAHGAIVSVGCNARSDVNAACFWEVLFHNGATWVQSNHIRTHNNGSAATALGFATSAYIDRQETSLGDLRVAVNCNIDAGGGWVAVGTTHCQISFLYNG
jgi:hypothetical protein